MSRWDEKESEVSFDAEEARLLDKFYDYLELEKREVEKKNKVTSWKKKDFKISIMQSGVLIGLTALLLGLWSHQ